MTGDRVKPESEKLREAVRWLALNAPVTREKIDQAAMRFDLSPVDQEFLLREFSGRRERP